MSKKKKPKKVKKDKSLEENKINPNEVPFTPCDDCPVRIRICGGAFCT